MKKSGLKKKYKTIGGGAPVTQRWANRIGADPFAQDAGDGVKKSSITREPTKPVSLKAADHRSPADLLMQPQAHVLGSVETRVFLDHRTVADSDFKSRGLPLSPFTGVV